MRVLACIVMAHACFSTHCDGTRVFWHALWWHTRVLACIVVARARFPIQWQASGFFGCTHWTQVLPGIAAEKRLFAFHLAAKPAGEQGFFLTNHAGMCLVSVMQGRHFQMVRG